MAAINLDDNQLNSVIAKAIIDTITPERQSEIIAQAVRSLIDRKDSTRYDSPSVLQAAFNSAVGDVARKIAVEKVSGDADMRAAIDKLYLDAWKKLTEGDETYNKLVDKIANAMDRAISGDRY